MTETEPSSGELSNDELAMIDKAVEAGDFWKSLIQSSCKVASSAVPFLGPAAYQAAFEVRQRVNAARFQRHVTAVQEQMRRDVAYLHDRVDEVADRVIARSAEEAADRLQWNYAEQAIKEPIEERAVMLQHAAAAVIDVRMTIAEHAAVQRVLQELDPRNVLDLSVLDRVAGNVWKGSSYTTPDHLRHEVWSRMTVSSDILVTSGCVRVSYVGGTLNSPVHGEVAVTRLGKLVLRVLRSFVAARMEAADVPGRPSIPGSRTEDEARRLIGEALWNAALRLVPARYDYPKRGQSPADLPQPNAKAVLRFPLVAPVKAERLRGFAGDSHVAGAMPGTIVDGIAVTVRESDGQPAAEVLIHGPHDVMRWLAEAVEAEWV